MHARPITEKISAVQLRLALSVVDVVKHRHFVLNRFKNRCGHVIFAGWVIEVIAQNPLRSIPGGPPCPARLAQDVRPPQFKTAWEISFSRSAGGNSGRRWKAPGPFSAAIRQGFRIPVFFQPCSWHLRCKAHRCGPGVWRVTDRIGSHQKWGVALTRNFNKMRFNFFPGRGPSPILSSNVSKTGAKSQR